MKRTQQPHILLQAVPLEDGGLSLIVQELSPAIRELVMRRTGVDPIGKDARAADTVDCNCFDEWEAFVLHSMHTPPPQRGDYPDTQQ